MDEKKKILILGGGYAGVKAAKVLHHKLKKNKEVEITLVDRKNFHTLMTELHEVAGGRAEPESIQVSFKKIFGAKKVKVFTDEIQTIDFEEKKAVSRTHTYFYDYLVLGAGAEPSYFGIPGVQEMSYTLWSFDDALRLRAQIERCFRLAASEPDPQLRRELLTFVVAGGGFTGVEIAGELLEWKKRLCYLNGISENEVQVILVEALDSILTILAPSVREKAVKRLEKMGAEIRINSAISEAKDNKIFIKNFEPIASRTMIWTCGIQACAFGANLSLKKGNPRSRRLETNQHLQSVEYNNVYVVGDLNWTMLGEKPIPQIVETALQTGGIAAENIIREIEKKPLKIFHPKYHGFMVSIGGVYAVADVMNMKLTGFFAMAMKHLVNLHYLWETAGINAMWSYIQHHFLNVKDNRSMIGGHAAYPYRIYWVVALRLFLGVMWLSEGIGKITGGWLNPDNIYIPLGAASSGASVEQAAPHGALMASNAVNTIVPLLKEPFFLYTWFADMVLSKAPFFFQASVVMSGVAIGLALLAGLFTVPAAAASFGLCVMFILSCLGGKEVLWYMIAAIVMMGGAGRGFGLDYWVMPWIKKWWNGRKIVKKSYFYIDEPEK